MYKGLSKTPTIGPSNGPYVRRMYLINISIGNTFRAIGHSQIYKVIPIVKSLYLPSEPLAYTYTLSHHENIECLKILGSTSCTSETVELWRLISWSISIQFVSLCT